MKTCRKCEVAKPVDQFHKSKKGCSLGLHSYCKDCMKKASAESHARHAARKKAEYAARVATDPEGVRAQRHAQYLKISHKQREYDRQRRTEKRDELNAWKRAYYSQPEQRAARAAYLRNWYAENRETERVKRSAAYVENLAANRAKGRAANRRSYAKLSVTNRPKIVAMSALRRAARVRAKPAWADDRLIREFYETADALNMWTGEWHHVDHIVPLRGKTVCGLHTQANLQILPATENLSKLNRTWPDQP